MSKRNLNKKRVFQDNFIKRYCCSSHNHLEGWMWWKRKNRKRDRGKRKEETREEIDDASM